MNVYLPSGTNKLTERENFIVTELPYFLRRQYKTLILGGDFNCVLNPKDQKGVFQSAPTLRQLVTDLKLTDAWEHIKPNEVVFTYYRGESASRLDRIYVDKDSSTFIYNVEVLKIAFSDHECFVMSFQIKEKINITGRSYWKLNSSLYGSKDEIKILHYSSGNYCQNKNLLLCLNSIIGSAN